MLRRPVVPEDCQHGGHIYYVVLSLNLDRGRLLDFLRARNIWPMFHYVPLHSSPAGKRFGRAHSDLPVTEVISRQLIRLPLWLGISEKQQERVVAALAEGVH